MKAEKPFLLTLIEDGHLSSMEELDDPFIHTTVFVHWTNWWKVLRGKYKFIVNISAPPEVINAVIEGVKPSAKAAPAVDQEKQDLLRTLNPNHTEAQHKRAQERLAELRADPNTEVQELTNEDLEQFGSRETIPDGMTIRVFHKRGKSTS